MNEAQRQWTSKKQDELEAYCSKHYPLSDQEANEVVEWIDKTGERKWCKQKFNHTERGETRKKIKLSKQRVNNILEIIETIIKGIEVSDER